MPNHRSVYHILIHLPIGSTSNALLEKDEFCLISEERKSALPLSCSIGKSTFVKNNDTPGP